MTIERVLSFSIPMKKYDGRNAWTLVITRRKKPGDIGDLEFALQWGNKETPTYETDISLDEAREMFAELLHDDDSSPI